MDSMGTRDPVERVNKRHSVGQGKERWRYVRRVVRERFSHSCSSLCHLQTIQRALKSEVTYSEQSDDKQARVTGFEGFAEQRKSICLLSSLQTDMCTCTKLKKRE